MVPDNLAKRTTTGLMLVFIIAASIMASPFSFILLILTINVLSLQEFYCLFFSSILQPRKTGGILLSASIFITTILFISGINDWSILLINIPLIFALFISELYLKADNAFHNLAFTFLGIICITIPLCFFTSITFLPIGQGIYHYQLALGYFFILWINDSVAFFTGKYFGRHRLFERISPGKSWEGSLGGALTALLGVYLFSLLFTIIDLANWLIIAVIIVVTGTFGDLIKSLMKRSLHVKDSGNILPGHGGMLDRFDTMLGSAPFVFCYLILVHYA